MSSSTRCGLNGGSAPAVEPVGPIEVRLQATLAQIAPLRAVAGDLAARADFDIDAVADIRMAVDEAAATLVALAAPGSAMCCCFQVEPSQLVVTVAVQTDAPHTVACNTFGWRVLTTLVDRIDVLGAPPGTAGGHRLGIRLWRARGAEPGP